MDTALVTAFKLFGSGIVSLVGAGGKTTLMFRLAGELADSGRRVLTTTTTKIFRPTPSQSSLVLVSNDPAEILRQADRCPADGFHMTAASAFDAKSEKLLGYRSEALSDFRKSGRFQWILVEADGAARKPLKAPAAHEPVIPADTAVLIAVIGLDAIGEALTDERVFRADLYARLTGLSIGQAVTVESVCTALLHPEGIMKGCPDRARKVVFLNKAETPDRLAAGRKVGGMLFAAGRKTVTDVLMGSLLDEKASIESVFGFIHQQKACEKCRP